MQAKEGFCTLFFRPKTRPKTSQQCFALEQRKSKAKHCRDVLERVLGQKKQGTRSVLMAEILIRVCYFFVLQSLY